MNWFDRDKIIIYNNFNISCCKSSNWAGYCVSSLKRGNVILDARV